MVAMPSDLLVLVIRLLVLIYNLVPVPNASSETQLGPTHQLPRPYIVRDTYTHNDESLLPTYSGHQFGTVSERSVTVGTGVNPQPTRVVQKHSSHDERRRKQINHNDVTLFCLLNTPLVRIVKMSSGSFRVVSYTCNSVLPLFVFPERLLRSRERSSVLRQQN